MFLGLPSAVDDLVRARERSSSNSAAVTSLFTASRTRSAASDLRNVDAIECVSIQ